MGTSCHIWVYRECVFYCFWKCYDAVDVRSLCLMHNDGVSSELELCLNCKTSENLLANAAFLSSCWTGYNTQKIDWP